MLYLISGASRSGKTIVARQMAQQLGIPYLSLDWIMMGFTNGIPEYGIHDKLFPDEIAHRMWPFLKAMLDSMIYVETDGIIEGEAILPKLILELMDKHPSQIKVCFVGYTDVGIDEKVQTIKDYSVMKNDWLCEKSDAYIKDHVENMIHHSKEIRAACEKYHLKYIDTSNDFGQAVGEITRYFGSPL